MLTAPTVTDRMRIFDGSGWKEGELEEFFRLPHDVRLRHILGGTVEFLRDGRLRDVREVLTERNMGPAEEPPPRPKSPNERGPTKRLRAVK